MSDVPGMHRDDVIAALTPLSFDISELELHLPLTLGARIHLVDEDDSRSGDRLWSAIEAGGATVVQATPATWQMLLDAEGPGSAVALRALVGGDQLPLPLASAMTERFAEVWNLYGPTETTVWSMAARLCDGAPHLGAPIDNTAVYVLDRRLRPVPPGVRGELWIGGLGLARGYVGRPRRTAESFLPDPFAAEPGRADVSNRGSRSPSGRWLARVPRPR